MLMKPCEFGGIERAVGTLESSGKDVALGLRTSANSDSRVAVRPAEFYELQEGGWCGKHALNNYLGGPYVQKDDCLRAAQQVCSHLSENMSEHLDEQTGWLSIDVINVLCAANFGVEVEPASFPVADLADEDDVAFLINCNQQHWTVLRHCVGWGVGAY